MGLLYGIRILGRRFFCFITIHAFDRWTERRIDLSLVAKIALHRCSMLQTVTGSD